MANQLPFNPEFIRGSISPDDQATIEQIIREQQSLTVGVTLPRTKPGTPVSLTGSVLLNPGSSLPINTDALRNPSKLPLAIHEIKFVSSTGATPVAAAAVGSGGGTVPPASSSVLEATIKLGRYPVTKTPVPLNLLGVRRSAVVEVFGKPDGTNIYGLANQTWRLDAPLILRGGEALDVTIGHRGFYPYQLTAYATISGRFLASLPKTMQVPYVASFVPTAFNPSTGTADTLVRTSTERDLANELRTALKVRRFVGKVSTIANGFTQVWDLVPMVNSQLATVSMRCVSGVPTVRFDTPFENVFDAFSGAWECPHNLPPGAYWIVVLKCAGTSTTVAQVQPAIALIGTREERT